MENKVNECMKGKGKGLIKNGFTVQISTTETFLLMFIFIDHCAITFSKFL